MCYTPSYFILSFNIVANMQNIFNSDQSFDLRYVALKWKFLFLVFFKPSGQIPHMQILRIVQVMGNSVTSCGF